MLVLWLWQKPQIASVWVDSTRAQAESLAAVVSQNEATRDDADDYRAAQPDEVSLHGMRSNIRRFASCTGRVRHFDVLIDGDMFYEFE